jgi:hypothetical protein
MEHSKIQESYIIELFDNKSNFPEDSVQVNSDTLSNMFIENFRSVTCLVKN